MSDDELDLTRGDPERTARITAQQEAGKSRRPAAKKTVSNSGATRQKSTAGARIEAELQSRLMRTVDRIVEQLVARQDHELATALQDDREQIVQGFVSMTRTVGWLRSPLLMVLNLIEPMLAFWRVGRILLGRWYTKRAMRAQATQEAAAMPGPQPAQHEMWSQPEPVVGPRQAAAEAFDVGRTE